MNNLFMRYVLLFQEVPGAWQREVLAKRSSTQLLPAVPRQCQAIACRQCIIL